MIIIMVTFDRFDEFLCWCTNHVERFLLMYVVRDRSFLSFLLHDILYMIIVLMIVTITII